MGARASTASKAASKQLLKEIRLGTLGSVKERIESSSSKPGETTTEGVSAKCIGIKPGLL